MSVRRFPKVGVPRAVRDELREFVWLSLTLAAISAASIGLAAVIALGLDGYVSWL